MNSFEDLRRIDPESASQQICEMIRSTMSELNRDGLILGLSGGLDSGVVAYLCKNSIDPEKIRLLYLPDRDSNPRHRKDAESVAAELGIPLKIKDISPILEIIGVYNLLPIRFVPGRKLKGALVQLGKRWMKFNSENILQERLSPKRKELVSKACAYITIKHQIRMVILYQEANIQNLMVVGAANKTEWLTGTFIQWGCDHCADIMPILHLYRSQVELLAEYLRVPEKIRNKPADPDIIPGVENKEELLGSFLNTDVILWGLENGVSMKILANRFSIDEVQQVQALFESSCFMRDIPYHYSRIDR